MSVFKQFNGLSSSELAERLDKTEVKIIDDYTISSSKARDLIFERNMLITYLNMQGESVLNFIMRYGTKEQRDRLTKFQEKLCENPFGYNPYEVCNIEDGVNYFKSIGRRMSISSNDTIEIKTSHFSNTSYPRSLL